MTNYRQSSNAPGKLPRSVLFICNQNAVRSPMAKALAEKYFRRRVYVDSVGLIAGALDPFSVAAMAEENIDITQHQPKTLDDINLTDFEVIVTLTSESRDYIEKHYPESRTLLTDYWVTPDPSDAEGNRNQVLDSYRLVRDHIECRIADKFHLNEPTS